jgi:hypothetical protein
MSMNLQKEVMDPLESLIYSMRIHVLLLQLLKPHLEEFDKKMMSLSTTSTSTGQPTIQSQSQSQPQSAMHCFHKVSS